LLKRAFWQELHQKLDDYLDTFMKVEGAGSGINCRQLEGPDSFGEGRRWGMRTLVVLCSLVWIAVSCSKPQAAQLPIEQRVGWIDSNCLATENKRLEEGMTMTVVVFGDTESIAEVRIMGATQSAALCPPLHDDRRAINSKSLSFYEIAPQDGRKIELGIGLIGNVSRVGTGIDMNGDGKPDQFTHCATSEGISFGIWNDTPYKGKAMWSGYYYLGYDVDPTCP
jgi:hypothetical protein